MKEISIKRLSYSKVRKTVHVTRSSKNSTCYLHLDKQNMLHTIRIIAHVTRS